MLVRKEEVVSFSKVFAPGYFVKVVLMGFGDQLRGLEFIRVSHPCLRRLGHGS
jgi:hypothetical protein